MKYMTRADITRRDKELPFVVILPRHEDHPVGQMRGDPRKVWLYAGAATGRWACEDEEDKSSWPYIRNRAYRFSQEGDAMMFRLKWA